jgi:NAD/NADP transhydrogenase alpha subunit
VIIGVPKEIYPGERRVALVPMVIPMLTKAGCEVVIEAGAGEEAGYPDSHYLQKGAKIIPERSAVFETSDIIVQVLCYGSNDITGKADLPLLRRNQVLIGFLRPLGSMEVVQEIANTGVTAFSVELVPRTTRAQSMDALSSMGTVCGYKAALIAAFEQRRDCFTLDRCGLLVAEFLQCPDELGLEPHRVLALEGAVPVEGGIPLVAGGQIVGAIGLSGGTSAQDGQCAKAGADSVR